MSSNAWRSDRSRQSSDGNTRWQGNGNRSERWRYDQSNPTRSGDGRGLFTHSSADRRAHPTSAHQSGCMCTVQKCAYPPRPSRREESHTARIGDVRGGLIGGFEQFCRAFYHANQWEAEVYLCLRSAIAPSGTELVRPTREQEKRDPFRCGKAQVAILAKLSLEGGEDYVARYANCFRGRSEDNVHAEEFLLADTQLRALLQPGGRARALTLYMSYQPCHHSGGHLPENEHVAHEVAMRRANQGHPTSCSERLRDFNRQTLAPLGVPLLLVVADLYKVMWTEELMTGPNATLERFTYGGDSASGREGMLLLLREPGVSMRATNELDWEFIVSHCDDDVRDHYARRGDDVSRFTRVHVNLRAKLDAHLAEFIAQMAARAAGEIGKGNGAQPQPQPVPPPPAAPPAPLHANASADANANANASSHAEAHAEADAHVLSDADACDSGGGTHGGSSSRSGVSTHARGAETEAGGGGGDAGGSEHVGGGGEHVGGGGKDVGGGSVGACGGARRRTGDAPAHELDTEASRLSKMTLEMAGVASGVSAGVTGAGDLNSGEAATEDQ